MHAIPISLHHFEVCVSDLSFLNLLVNGYGFKKWMERRTSECHQYVVRSRYCIFIVTKRFSEVCNIKEDKISNEICNNTALIGTYPVLFCCADSRNHDNDAVFNMSLEVPNIERAINLISSYGGYVLRDPEVIEDQNGYIKYAVVSPPCKNLIHTLIEKRSYMGFLPGFHSVDENNGLLGETVSTSNCMMEYIDHVAFVTEPGDSSVLIQWYENVFSMKRLFTNREETLADGFVLRDCIGLRLKALQYWRCAETGVTQPANDNPDQLKIVIAEPLPEVRESHVQAFLKANGGPGVQHIAFYTNSIFESVAKTTNAGVKFRKPPYTYYEEIVDRKELRDTGMQKSLEKLEKLGILIDFEEAEQKINYLMQIFSYPVFERDTFFLEVIQRHGANGFGSGNITALARSIIRYQQDMMQKSISNETKMSLPIADDKQRESI